MALSPRMSNEAANAEANGVAALLNNGYLRIYSGAQPATGDTAIGAQVLLAELRWNATAFGAAAAGVIVANAITADSSANATGTAAWFRALKSDGTSPVYDGSVGTSAADLIMPSTSITAGQVISVNSATLTFPKS